MRALHSFDRDREAMRNVYHLLTQLLSAALQFPEYCSKWLDFDQCNMWRHLYPHPCVHCDFHSILVLRASLSV